MDEEMTYLHEPPFKKLRIGDKGYRFHLIKDGQFERGFLEGSKERRWWQRKATDVHEVAKAPVQPASGAYPS